MNSSITTAAPNDLISATLWQPGAAPHDLDSDARESSGIRWFDLRSGGGPQELHRFLEPLCEGLTLGMLEDLLVPDRRPQGKQWAEGRVRLASTFAVYPTKTKDGRDDWSCPVPSADLLYQPVELLSNAGWLLTCWHPTETYRGWDLLGEPGLPRAHEEVKSAVAKRWETKRSATAADLGLLVMHELALTYAPADRQLYAALEEWELELYGDVQGDLTRLKADPKGLRDLWRARARLWDWLNPLNVPGLRADINKAWLPASDLEEVVRVDDRVDRALAAWASSVTVFAARFTASSC